MLTAPEPLSFVLRTFDPFATAANARQRALLALNTGIAGIVEEDDFAEPEEIEVDEQPDQMPGTVQAQNVTATKKAKAKKAKAKKAKKPKKGAAFVQQRAATPGYSVTPSGSVSQRGGVTARAHIEDQLFNRAERARRAVRDKSREIADRMRERQAALFDAEMNRQAAMREAEARVADAQTATLLAQREAALFRQEAELAKRVDPSEYEEEIIDAEASEPEPDDSEDPDGFDGEEFDDYGDEAYEGQAGFFDFVKKVVAPAASFIPGVGPIVGSALDAVAKGDKSKGARVAAAVDPNAKLVATRNGAPSFEVNLEQVGKVLLDSIGRVIARKTGGTYQPLPEPKPIDIYAAERRRSAAQGATGNAALPLLVIGGGALLLLAVRRSR